MLTITEDAFGRAIDPTTQTSETIRRFTFTNANGMVVQVLSLGAIISSIKVPDGKGSIDDVVLGFDDISGYTDPTNTHYIGATIGRVANRINKGCFRLNGKKIKVSKNLNEKHTLHGGFYGFDKKQWIVTQVVHDNAQLKMKCVSPAKEEGFPGELTAIVTCNLTADNCFKMLFKATTTRPTPVNITNHSYFNLAGHGAGRGALYDHEISIQASKITATDKDSIPTGRLMDVASTPYDLRGSSVLFDRMLTLSGKGFDENYCVNHKQEGIKVVAKAVYPKTGRWLEVSSDQPGLQFYTGNSLPDVAQLETPILGKEGSKYAKQCAFCFETQGYPDAVNHARFPSVVLRPGDLYEHNLIYRFGTQEPTN